MSNPGRVNASVSPTTRYRGPATMPQASSALVSLVAVSEPAPAAPAPGVVILSIIVISSLLGPLVGDSPILDVSVLARLPCYTGSTGPSSTPRGGPYGKGSSEGTRRRGREGSGRGPDRSEEEGRPARERGRDPRSGHHALPAQRIPRHQHGRDRGAGRR